MRGGAGASESRGRITKSLNETKRKKEGRERRGGGARKGGADSSLSQIEGQEKEEEKSRVKERGGEDTRG